MSGAVVEIPDPMRWDAFVESHGGHLLQSYAWGELKREFGWRVLRLGLCEGDRLTAAIQILLHSAPFRALAYTPRGPVWDENRPESLAPLLEGAAQRVQGRHSFLLRIEPNLLEPSSAAETLTRTGFAATSETVQPRTTIHLDLTQGLDALLAGMKPKWRYNIRLAAKRGVTVRDGRPEDLREVYRLLQVTGTRDRFGVHSFDYYRRAAELLAPGERGKWLVGCYEGKIIAAIFVTAFGREAIYLYGASGNEHRDRMPNHALHWAALQWAHARGCTHYDWWGVPEPSDESENALLPEGLYRFKQGFGGALVRYVGAWDRVLSPFWFSLYRRMRKKS